MTQRQQVTGPVVIVLQLESSEAIGARCPVQIGSVPSVILQPFEEPVEGAGWTGRRLLGQGGSDLFPSVQGRVTSLADVIGLRINLMFFSQTSGPGQQI